MLRAFGYVLGLFSFCSSIFESRKAITKESCLAYLIFSSNRVLISPRTLNLLSAKVKDIFKGMNILIDSNVHHYKITKVFILKSVNVSFNTHGEVKKSVIFI